MNFKKRAIKFLKRDNLDIQKINDVLEIDRQNERSSSDESDSNSANDSSTNSPRSVTFASVFDLFIADVYDFNSCLGRKKNGHQRKKVIWS